MQTTFDFITHTLVIGGGPAGSTVARKLANANIDVILIEKNFSFDKPCGGGVKSIVFKEFNILQELESKRVENFRLYSPKHFSDANLSKTPISIVLRKDFDKKNRELAKDAGAKVIEGRFLNSVLEDDYVKATIKTKDKILKIKTNYLVAADGVKSTVRKNLTNSYTKSILTHYCNIPNQTIDRCEFYFGKKFAPKEYAWVFPHGDKLSVGTVLKDESNSKKLFLEFKNSIVPNDNTKIQGFYIPTWQENDLFFKDNHFFVGDAAGQVLPFTYEGIYYAMKSAKILADAIIKDCPELYEINWNKKYKKRFKFFKSMQNIFL